MTKTDSKRIFINQIDTFESFNLAKYLSQCVVGASLEGGEEEAAEDEEQADQAARSQEGRYKVSGTTKDPLFPKPAFVDEILKYESKSDLLDHVMEFDIIIYAINDNPAQVEEAVTVVNHLASVAETMEKTRVFVLLSTVMTWARSKQPDPEDKEVPFTEEDYRRRKPHVNFEQHCAAEKALVKAAKRAKKSLSTYIVAAGLTYGQGENVFHYFLKSAWHNMTELHIIGDGTNVLPTIYINDLATVVQNVIDLKPKVRYILAVDSSKHTQEEIVKSISVTLSTGKIKRIPKEEAVLDKNLSQQDFDMLTVDLRMEPTTVKDGMNVRWKYEGGLVENIGAIVKEFKDTRKLMPLRVLIHGPPGVGKSTVARQLALHYKVHHIHAKHVIDDAIQRLERSVARVDVEQGEEEGGDEDLAAKAAEDQETLDAIREMMQNTGRIEDQYVMKFFREKLLSKPCQNQGFILDGYPKTREQAQEVFAPDEDNGEEEEAKSFNKLLMPDFVIELEAPDEYLRDRIINLPERLVQGTNLTEEAFSKRIETYRNLNTEDDTVLNFFDEFEVHPEHIDVSRDRSELYRDTVESLKKLFGQPRNYGATPEEVAFKKQLEDEERAAKEETERREREENEAKEAEKRKRRQDDWASKVEAIRREQLEMLETQSLPLRHYLMKNVMPTLTQSLVECVRLRPEDPVDFVAEYLFKHNPQVD